MEIILPCAGLSTRFPNLRPKYLLTDYKGKLMVENAVENYIGKHNITIVILEKHDKDFGSVRKLREAFGQAINIVVLDHPTSGPADTVYQGILKGNINLDSTILIKDCDSFFDASEVEGNSICVASLTKNPNVRNAAAKSYVVTNEQNIITTVIEKKIVSENFCVGGYQFNSAKEFVNAFESLKDNISKEIFVSEIIDYVISQGSVFIMNEVENFIDVGTSDDWFSYNNKPTYFCDIDGTILKSKFFYDKEYESLTSNVNTLLKEQNRGCKFVFCTSRDKKYELLTREILDELGFVNYELVMNVHHTKRVLLNDYANSNPYPTAIAVNIKRDDDNLADLL